MAKRLAPYGSMSGARHVAKVSKGKTPPSLSIRLPSADLVAKAGTNWAFRGSRNRLVVRRNSED